MKSDKLKSAVYILAVTGFFASISTFSIKYFHSGAGDFSLSVGGLFIPTIVILVLKLNQPKKIKSDKN